MSRDHELGGAFRRLEEQVRHDVVAPHPGEILVRARQQTGAAPGSRHRRVRRVTGFLALAVSVPVALGLLLVLLPQPGPALVPATDGPQVAGEDAVAEEDWANPTARRTEPEPEQPAADGAAVVPPGPVGPPPPDPPDTVTVTVWFQTDERRRDGCRRWEEVAREVPAADPIRGTIEAVLAGPSPQEREDGLFSVYGVGEVPTTAELTLDEERQRVRVDLTDLYQVDYSERASCRSQDLRGPIDRALKENFDEWGYSFRVAGSNEAFRSYVDQEKPISEAMALVEEQRLDLPTPPIEEPALP